MDDTLSAIDRNTLEIAATYGPCIDFGGRASTMNQRNSAKRMIERGFLSGQYRNCTITDDGDKVLALTQAEDVQRRNLP